MPLVVALIAHLHFSVCFVLLKNLHFCLTLLYCYHVQILLLAVAVALFVHLHFCRLFCVAYKFTFSSLAVVLFTILHFCCLLLHFLHIYSLPLAVALFGIYVFAAHCCIVFAAHCCIVFATHCFTRSYFATCRYSCIVCAFTTLMLKYPNTSAMSSFLDSVF